MAAKRFKLPAPLDVVDCVVEDADQWYGPDRYVRATVGEGAAAFVIDINPKLLTEVKPPLPEEPPIGSVVLDDDGHAWQRFARAVGDPRTSEWFSAGEAADEDWAGLNAYGPLTRLVPDPFAEPIGLPWTTGPVGVGYEPFGLGGGPHKVAVSVRGEQANVTAMVARDMARALWAAADQAEKEQS